MGRTWTIDRRALDGDDDGRIVGVGEDVSSKPLGGFFPSERQRLERKEEKGLQGQMGVFERREQGTARLIPEIQGEQPEESAAKGAAALRRFTLRIRGRIRTRLYWSSSIHRGSPGTA